MDQQPTYAARDMVMGFHPEGFRIDKTAAPLKRYTKWTLTASGDWLDPVPVCFHALPEHGWHKAEHIDWSDDAPKHSGGERHD